MTWCAASLALVLAATPPGARRFNSEPVALAGAGVVALAFSAWRFGAAETLYGQLVDLKVRSTSVTSPAEAAKILSEARALAFNGNSETALAGTLAIMGSLLLVTGIVWFLVEGRETTDWLTLTF
jgi:hypothetical protein